MHALLEEFLDKWVWPTMPGAPGADFRLRITRDKCIKGWETNLARTLGDIEEELKTNDEPWKKTHALRGYGGEGVKMLKKQAARPVSPGRHRQKKKKHPPAARPPPPDLGRVQAFQAPR